MKQSEKTAIVLIGLLLTLILISQAQFAPTEEKLQINLKVNYDQTVPMLSVSYGGTDITSVTASLRLHITFSGVATSGVFDGTLRVLFDGIERRRVPIQTSGLVTSGQTHELASVEVTSQEMESWVTVDGSYVLAFEVLSGSTLTVTFGDGSTESETFSAVQSQITVAVQKPPAPPPVQMVTGVNYEGPFDWAYTVSDSKLDADFTLFKQNNVDYIIINLLWSVMQTGVNPARYNTRNIANVKRVLAKAEQYGISVCMSFFQYWMDTTTGVPSWCVDQYGNRRTWAIVREGGSRTIRGYFLEMVGDLVDEFKGSSAIKCWSLLNEPMHMGSYSASALATEREEFHLLIEAGSAVIKARDTRPVSVRFTLPYSPWHTRTSGAFSAFVDFDRVMQSLDFMSINTYADPADYPGGSWYGTTWNDFVEAVQDTKNAGYTFWVSEFGNNRDDETQRRHYEGTIQIFQNLGVDACFGWMWTSTYGAGDYNICNRGTPRPAFYELNIG